MKRYAETQKPMPYWALARSRLVAVNLLQWQGQQVIRHAVICDSLNVLDPPVAVDMDPGALMLWIAIRAPHRGIPVLLDVGNHLVPSTVPTFQHLPGVVHLGD